MMRVRNYATIAFWTALFPLLVVIGNAFILLELWPLLNFQAFPWSTALFEYMGGYALITIGVILLSRAIDKKGIVQTVKYLGWPKGALDGVISFFTGTIVGILSFLLIIWGTFFLLIITTYSIGFGALSGGLAVLLVGPPEELARCYIQKKLAGSLDRCRKGTFGNILCLAFITVAFGLAHEVGRLFSSLFTSGSIYLFAFQDISWYLGGFILALLYVIKKNWFANSVAHSWYNLLTTFLLH